LPGDSLRLRWGGRRGPPNDTPMSQRRDIGGHLRGLGDHFKTRSCDLAGQGYPHPDEGVDKVGASTRELVSWEFGVESLTSVPVTRVGHSRSPWATKGIASCAPHVALPVARRRSEPV
jgi:hypothetical protein